MRTARMQLGAWLACAALAGAAGARQDEAVDWQAWKGAPSLQTKAPGEFQRKIADDRAWLAQMRVQLLTGRPPEGAEWQERLGEARLHATSAIAFPGQRELMVEAALTRSQALAALGRADEARAALEELLLAPGDPLVAENRQHCTDATPVLLALAQEALGDPTLEQQRQALGGGARQAAPADEGLEARLRQAVREGDHELLEQVGARSAPAIEEALAADLGRLPEGRDLLALLVKVNERRAAVFALEHLDAGQAFRLRVIRAMQANSVFTRDTRDFGAWSGGFRHALVPEWPLVVAGLLRHPDSAGDALALVGWMVHADALSPEVTAALIEALQRSGPALMPELNRVLGPGSQSSARGLYAYLAASGDTSVRQQAADKLRALGEVPALLGRLEDPDPQVRTTIAWALRGNQDRPPAVDDAAVSGLRRLLADSSAHVRRAAASALVAMPLALEPELYRAAAHDPDAGVRAALAWVKHPDDALVGELLLSLARDDDPSVREEVDGCLTRRDSMPPALVPAAHLRLSDPRLPVEKRAALIRLLGKSDVGLQALASIVAADPRGSAAQAVLETALHFTSSTGSRMSSLLVLDDAALATVYTATYGSSQALFYELDGFLDRASPPRWAAMQAVLENTAAPADVRLHAAVHAAAGGGERFRAALLALLASEPLRSRVLSEAEAETLGRALDALPDEDRNPLALAAMKDAALHDRARAQIAGRYVARGPLARELTLAVLARWLDAEDDRAALAVSTALFHLRELPESADPSLLERALHHPVYASSAVETMAALRDSRFLPAFESALKADWLSDVGTRRDVQANAARALGSMPGDESAEILLSAAASSPEPARTFALEALTARRQTEEQRRLWEDSKQGRLERSSAVQRLLEQLQDRDAAVRAQAARALGTLGALETLPLLIDLLKDADPGVRQAAGEALERLNAPPAKAG